MSTWKTMMVCALAIGCGGGAPPPAVAKSSTTNYRKGDFIVYRYTGLFTPAGTDLREEITKQDGDRLTIDVTATRGAEQRHWQQVVIDTPAHQRDNAVEELYEYVGGERRKLANDNNADLVRLYAWTVLTPDGKATNVRTASAMFEISHRNYTCERSEGENVWHGRHLKFETFECPDFLWKHGRARFWDDKTGEEILRADVADLGTTSP